MTLRYDAHIDAFYVTPRGVEHCLRTQAEIIAMLRKLELQRYRNGK
jgi:hypothetical protein